MELWIKLFVLVVLIGLSGFFSGVEAAFISLSRMKLRHMLDKKLYGSGTVKELKDNTSRLITTLLIGNNIVNIGASAIATSAAIDFFGSTGVGIATGVMTLLVLIFGEITPKTVAMAHSEAICRYSSGIIKWMGIFLFPLVFIFERFSNLIGSFVRSGKESQGVTEEEIKSYIRWGEEVGSIDKSEKEMIHNIFRLNDIEAREIMTPRINILAFDGEARLGDYIDIIIKSGHSRIPVYKGNLDRITGMLYAKDVLRYQKDAKTDIKIKDIAKPVIIVPETKKINELLGEFQKKAKHIAVLVDEYGVVSGVVTIEDILEEIVGEIYDESDLRRELVVRIDRQNAKFSGEATIEDIRRMLKIRIEPNGSYETISGFIMARLGRIPVKGDLITDSNFEIIVERVEDNRIIEGKIFRK